MAVGDSSFPVMYPVKGCRLAAAPAGIKYKNRLDTVLFEFVEGSAVVGVFTQNAFCAAPVWVCKEHIQHPIRALIINSGNANACTGEPGIKAARSCCDAVAAQLGCSAEQVLPFSTGVIGEPLPAQKIIDAIPVLANGLSETHWDVVARAIMTTDTYPKGASEQIQIAGQTVTVTGIAKGSGMIKPNMATMLGYIATDAAVDPLLLKLIHGRLVDKSFNRVSVDGDTSTNDSCILVATGKAGNASISRLDSEAGQALYNALLRVYQKLAQALIRDGEGATKFITLDIRGGARESECLQVGYAVAESPLIKTAFFASDPNWGRIVAAIGYAGVDGLDPSLVNVYLDDVQIVLNGMRNPSYTEAQGAAIFQKSEFTVTIDLGRGSAHETLWTCDFSYDYVKINADYRS